MKASTTGGRVGIQAKTAAARWILAATILGSGMAMLDATIVNVALARIGEELRVGFGGLQWITNSYTLTLASFILLGGVLGDRYGRRRVFLIGTVAFAGASLLCAVSLTAQMLIFARALQGVGGALLTPGSLAIISSVFVRADRPWAIGAWSGLGGLATALGPFLGGWLVELSWRWVFLINLPVAVVVVILALRHVPETSQPLAADRRVDLLAAGLLVVALGGLAAGLTRAGEAGWGPGPAFLCVVGTAAAVGFVIWERRTANPLVPLSIFTNRTFAVANIATAFVYAGVGVYFFLVVIALQIVSGWSPLEAGATLLPTTVLLLVTSARFGSLSQRTGPRVLLSVGSLTAAGGVLLSLRIGVDAQFVPDVLPASVLVGLGLSCVVAPLTATVLTALPDELAGTASGINNAVARTAGLLAVVAVPAAAGLTAAAPTDTPALQHGYTTSMVVAAALLLIAAVTSWAGLAQRDSLEGDRADNPIGSSGGSPSRYQCPIGAPTLRDG